MAFKALHWDSRKQLMLVEDDVMESFSNAIFVACLQISLLVITAVVMGV